MKEKDKQEAENYSIEDVEQIKELWSKTYNTEGKPDWSHILPYYADDIYFRDSIQGIKGIKEFSEMTKRLSDRSKDLKMKVVRAMMENQTIFVEWEMTISFKTRPSSVLYGSSRLSINDEGKIAEQRDYYDLWGDIFDNIPGLIKCTENLCIGNLVKNSLWHEIKTFGNTSGNMKYPT